MATTSAAPTGVSLKDSKLFRQANYIDGAWVDGLLPPPRTVYPSNVRPFRAPS